LTCVRVLPDQAAIASVPKCDGKIKGMGEKEEGKDNSHSCTMTSRRHQEGEDQQNLALVIGTPPPAPIWISTQPAAACDWYCKRWRGRSQPWGWGLGLALFGKQPWWPTSVSGHWWKFSLRCLNSNTAPESSLAQPSLF